MSKLYRKVDPEGLLEHSVAFADRALAQPDPAKAEREARAFAQPPAGYGRA